MYKQLAAMSDWPSWLRWCVVRLVRPADQRRYRLYGRVGR